MHIHDAMTSLLDGATIRRPSFPAGCGFKLSADAGAVTMVDAEGDTEVPRWSFNTSDFQADDWEIL
jgi:hypothetical protein